MFNTGIELEQPDAIPVIASFLLPLCVNQETLLLIMQCVEEGGLALGLGRQNEHLFPFWQALGYIADPENAPCAQSVPSVTEAKEIIKYVSNSIESEEEMACLEVVFFGGKAYLQQKCGCDDTRFYELSSVQIDESGLPLPTNDAPENSAIVGIGTVSESNANCYAQKATAYLLKRAYDYASAAIGAVSIASDQFELISETVEVADTIYEFFSGNNNDIDTLREYTESQVYSALFSPQVVTALESAWGFTGKVSRSQLYKWTQKAPMIVNGVPVRMVLDLWVTSSLIAFYNARLAEIAISCEVGNDFLPEQTEFIEIFSDTSYKLLQFSVSKTFSIVGDKLTIADFSTPIYAVAWKTTNSGGGFGTSATIHAKINGTIISGIVLGEVENEPLLAGFGAATTMVINNSDYAVSVGNFATGSYVSGELTLEMTQNSNTWVSSVSEIFVVIGA